MQRLGGGVYGTIHGQNTRPQPFELSVWLVARIGLTSDDAEIRFESKWLAERAIKAAENTGNLRAKNAILRERA